MDGRVSLAPGSTRESEREKIPGYSTICLDRGGKNCWKEENKNGENAGAPTHSVLWQNTQTFTLFLRYNYSCLVELLLDPIDPGKSQVSWYYYELPCLLVAVVVGGA